MRLTRPADWSFSRCSRRVGLLRLIRLLRSVTVSRRPSRCFRMPTRPVEARHNPEYKGTLGVHLHRVDVELPGDEAGGVILANIAIFDQMGEHAIRENFRDALFYGTQGALAVCDIERPDTLHTLSEWIRAVAAVAGGVPFRIVFNKVDRAKGSKIGPAESAWLKH